MQQPAPEPSYRIVRMAGRDCVDIGQVVIGAAHVPRPTPIFKHAELLQSALLDPRTASKPGPIRRVLGAFWRWA